MKEFIGYIVFWALFSIGYTIAYSIGYQNGKKTRLNKFDDAIWRLSDPNNHNPRMGYADVFLKTESETKASEKKSISECEFIRQVREQDGTKKITIQQKEYQNLKYGSGETRMIGLFRYIKLLENKAVDIYKYNGYEVVVNNTTKRIYFIT